MENHGVLVGWRHQDLGRNVMLAVETRQTPDHPEEFDVMRVLMTKNQAAVLANYLYQISGQSPPTTSERGWFHRMFG